MRKTGLWDIIIGAVNSLPTGYFFHDFLSSAEFFSKSTFSKKISQEYH